MNYRINNISPNEISLDWKNPRLADFGIKEGTSPEKIFSIMWRNMGVEEIIISITAHGFFKTEPIIVIKEEGKYIVIEGNRRLSAVKIILNPDLVESKLASNILSKITPTLQDSLKTIPVIEVTDRREAWQFIGFKHINGAAKWNSYAKAKYISQIHNEYNISLEDIAYQVGDTHNTVLKLYQGIMVIDQAERLKVFNKEDVFGNRLYFSHLYTGLQYNGFREYLGISGENMDTIDPVPVEYSENLGLLLNWLFGSKRDYVEPIIKTQNPDLRNLDKVLQNTEAIYALKANRNLDLAFEISRPTKDIFIENLAAAKRYLQKSWSFVNGYSGEEEYLRIAGSVANMADELYNKMEEIHNNKIGKDTKKRLSD